MEHEHNCPSDEKIAADVEEHRLSVMMIEEGEDGPKFAYSIGLYHNFQHPEVIVFGLNHQVAAWAINEIARRIQTSERCEIGKEVEGLLEGYNCTFREVPQKCHSDYFGYAMAFYKGSDFPALQLVWPDKQKRWPWEAEFNPDWLWQQPLLENWPQESSWLFDEPRNLGVFTTSPVLYEHYPILWVYHDGEDGAWQFLCGTTNEPEHCHLVCLKDIVEIDPSINELADLAPGWKAWREDTSKPWQKEPIFDNG